MMRRERRKVKRIYEEKTMENFRCNALQKQKCVAIQQMLGTPQ